MPIEAFLECSLANDISLASKLCLATEVSTVPFIATHKIRGHCRASLNGEASEEGGDG
jgi:hypothetical protein